VVYLAITCRCVIGLVLLVSAVGKLRSGSAFDEFTAWLARLPLPLVGKHPGLLGVVMVAAEAAAAVLVALPSAAVIGLLLAAVLLAVFTAGTSLAIARGTRAHCLCFGGSGAPLSLLHVVRDAALCLVAVAGAVASPAAGAHPAGAVTSLAGGAAVAIIVVFLDDVAALFAGSGDAGAGAFHGDGQ